MTVPLSSYGSAFPQLLQKGEGVELRVDEKEFLILGGEIHNSSASCLAYMDEKVWGKLVEHGCNTVLAPIYWELLEPEEGRYDFTLVDGLVEGARARGLRVVPLWFGTWKNAMSTYAPAWVKKDLARFPRAQISRGRNHGTISCLSEEACRADARAFRALMSHLRETDKDGTVIMVQVENEAGLLGASRDMSPLAEKVFQSAVPAELLSGLRSRGDALHPHFLRDWRQSDLRPEGTWPEVFGEVADEVFMAWHVARFINQVTKEGREEYPLPCFANAWLVQYDGEKPGSYPSGGPVSRMRDVWQIAAPDLFALAPDIYPDDFAGICADYASGGPLLIPEAKRSEEAASNVFYALGRHDALGFAPFGIESISDPLLAKAYDLLNSLVPVISAHRGTGRMTAVLQTTDEKETFLLENYTATVRYHAPRVADRAPAVALIIQETPDSLIVAGHGGLDINLTSRSLALPNVDFLHLEEGSYRQGEWLAGRRLNGDEYVFRLGSDPMVLRATLYRYA